MSLSRIKIIVIAMLALINAFFIAIIVIDMYTDAQDERQEIESVCAVLQSNGITINPDRVINANSLRTMRTAREVDMEANVAHAFLGQVETTDQRLVYVYENVERGIAVFSSASEFTISLNEGIITNANGTIRAVQELLNEMRLETSTPTISIEAESETIEVVGTYDGASIFNCVIDFVFSGGSLKTVTGRYVTGIEPVEDSAELSRVGTALLGFLAAVKKGDLECTEIYRVEAGYIYSVVGSFGEGVIEPAWMVTTADGRYSIDSATGEIARYRS